MQKIITYLWFDTQAEDAVQFYTSVLAHSRILEVTRNGSGGPGPEGSVFYIRFQLEGQEFIALNGGPQFKFNEAVSLFITCDTQQEVDRLWTRLSEGGEQGACGWLKDRYGLSWQVIPTRLLEMMNDSDPQRAARVTQAMLGMKKIDLAQAQRAYDGHPPAH